MAKVTDRYVQSARDYHDSNPEHEKALHQHYIDALEGLSEGARQHIIENGMADVMAHLHASSSERMALAAAKTADVQVPIAPASSRLAKTCCRVAQRFRRSKT